MPCVQPTSGPLGLLPSGDRSVILAIERPEDQGGLDGADVEAWIYHPTVQGPEVHRPGAGLVYMHGGPMMPYGYGFFDEFQLAAAEGFTIIAGNPRGSEGYGDYLAATVGETSNRFVASHPSHMQPTPLPHADPSIRGRLALPNRTG